MLICHFVRKFEESTDFKSPMPRFALKTKYFEKKEDNFTHFWLTYEELLTFLCIILLSGCNIKRVYK